MKLRHYIGKTYRRDFIERKILGIERSQALMEELRRKLNLKCTWLGLQKSKIELVR